MQGSAARTPRLTRRFSSSLLPWLAVWAVSLCGAAEAAPALISIGDAAVTEGNSGTVDAVFTLTLSRTSNADVTVDYATSDGTASVADADYVATSGTVTLLPGEVSHTITVPVNGDLIHEPDQTFLVTLSNAVGANISVGQGTGTILNDDPIPSLSIADAAILEGNSGTAILDLPVTLSGLTDDVVTVDFATQDGTALASDGDYVPASGTLTIPARSTTANAAVTVNGDVIVEPDETFAVNLSSPVNATIADGQGIGTITNDDHLHATFVQVAAGFTPYTFGTFGPAWGDYNGDGWVDLPLFRNNGNDNFSEIPGFRDLLNEGSYHGCKWADYDNDGDLDLVISCYAGVNPARTLLLRNDGPAGFTNVARELGVDITGFGETPVWGDFNGDGWLDLFVPYYPHVYPFRSFLYFNNGDGTFTEAAVAAGVDMSTLTEALKPEGAQAVDWDGDGDLDLYVASHLFQNDGTGTFTDVRAQVGLPQVFDEGAMFVDYDNDGDFDFYIRAAAGCSPMCSVPRLFRNDGGHFTEVTTAAGLSSLDMYWGDTWADVDNDGDLDFYLAVRDGPARLMLNQGNGTFVEDPTFTALGINIDLAAWGDYDNDGDLDLAIGGYEKRLYANHLNEQPGFAHTWLDVRAVDANGRLNQHGAAVRLHRLDDPPGVIQTRITGGGSNYLGQDEYKVHFGVVPSAHYALAVSFPNVQGLPLVVDQTVNPMLADLVPENVSLNTLTVYRDGRVEMGTGPVAVSGTPAAAQVGLRAPSPNPARTEARLTFGVPHAAHVSLAVYDMQGRVVRRLADEVLPAGPHTITWDRRDERGGRAAAGVYFCRLVEDGKPAGEHRLVVLD